MTSMAELDTLSDDELHTVQVDSLNTAITAVFQTDDTSKQEALNLHNSAIRVDTYKQVQIDSQSITSVNNTKIIQTITNSGLSTTIR